MEMGTSSVAATQQKRGPPSPGTSPVTSKSKVARVDSPSLIKTINQKLGWIEHTITLERTKKLTAASADGMNERVLEIRNAIAELCMENSRLQGITQFSAAEMSGILENFTRALTEKTAEVEQLKTENRSLKQSLEEKLSVTVGPTLSYAKVVSQPKAKPSRKASAPSQTPVTQEKTLGTARTTKTKDVKRKTLEKCRDAKTSTRFVVDVPAEMTVSQVKTDLWKAVTGKLPNPRAKSFVQGRPITVVPDDKSTFEVFSRLPNVRSVGPRVPRVIIYDVDKDIAGDQVPSGIYEQNPELGLTQDDVDSMTVKYRLGRRDGDSSHWVIETPAEVLKKLENKSVFLGLTRCRVRMHQNVPQCYKCQKFGHTSQKCNQASPTCKHCAKGHDSRECTSQGAAKCSNCRGDHKASSTACSARGKAIQSLLRRTDFGSQ